MDTPPILLPHLTRTLGSYDQAPDQIHTDRQTASTMHPSSPPPPQQQRQQTQEQPPQGQHHHHLKPVETPFSLDLQDKRARPYSFHQHTTNNTTPPTIDNTPDYTFSSLPSSSSSSSPVVIHNIANDQAVQQHGPVSATVLEVHSAQTRAQEKQPRFSQSDVVEIVLDSEAIDGPGESEEDSKGIKTEVVKMVYELTIKTRKDAGHKTLAQTLFATAAVADSPSVTFDSSSCFFASSSSSSSPSFVAGPSTPFLHPSSLSPASSATSSSACSPISTSPMSAASSPPTSAECFTPGSTTSGTFGKASFFSVTNNNNIQNNNSNGDNNNNKDNKDKHRHKDSKKSGINHNSSNHSLGGESIAPISASPSSHCSTTSFPFSPLSPSPRASFESSGSGHLFHGYNQQQQPHQEQLLLQDPYLRRQSPPASSTFSSGKFSFKLSMLDAFTMRLPKRFRKKDQKLAVPQELLDQPESIAEGDNVGYRGVDGQDEEESEGQEAAEAAAAPREVVQDENEPAEATTAKELVLAVTIGAEEHGTGSRAIIQQQPPQGRRTRVIANSFSFSTSTSTSSFLLSSPSSSLLSPPSSSPSPSNPTTTNNHPHPHPHLHPRSHTRSLSLSHSSPSSFLSSSNTNNHDSPTNQGSNLRSPTASTIVHTNSAHSLQQQRHSPPASHHHTLRPLSVGGSSSSSLPLSSVVGNTLSHTRKCSFGSRRNSVAPATEDVGIASLPSSSQQQQQQQQATHQGTISSPKSLDAKHFILHQQQQQQQPQALSQGQFQHLQRLQQSLYQGNDMEENEKPILSMPTPPTLIPRPTVASIPPSPSSSPSTLSLTDSVTPTAGTSASLASTSPVQTSTVLPTAIAEDSTVSVQQEMRPVDLFYQVMERTHTSQEQILESLQQLRRLILVHGIPDEEDPANIADNHAQQQQQQQQQQTKRRHHPANPSLRAKVWKLLLLVEQVSAKDYLALVKKRRPEEYSKIRNDTFRTLATDRKFLEVVEEDSLIRILCAFVWSNNSKAVALSSTAALSSSSGAPDSVRTNNGSATNSRDSTTVIRPKKSCPHITAMSMTAALPPTGAPLTLPSSSSKMLNAHIDQEHSNRRMEEHNASSAVAVAVAVAQQATESLSELMPTTEKSTGPGQKTNAKTTSTSSSSSSSLLSCMISSSALSSPMSSTSSSPSSGNAVIAGLEPTIETPSALSLDVADADASNQLHPQMAEKKSSSLSLRQQQQQQMLTRTTSQPLLETLGNRGDSDSGLDDNGSSRAQKDDDGETADIHRHHGQRSDGNHNNNNSNHGTVTSITSSCGASSSSGGQLLSPSGKMSFTYVQGMNVLAAPFLYVMAELDAFYSFSNFIKESCPLYVQPTLHGVHSGIRILDECLRIVDNELYEDLKSKNLSPQVYAFPSVLTLCACTPPLDQALQLWDFLLAWGLHLNIICVIAQLVRIRQDLLDSPRPMKLLRIFPDLNAQETIEDTIRIVKMLPDWLYDWLVRHPYDVQVEGEMSLLLPAFQAEHDAAARQQQHVSKKSKISNSSGETNTNQHHKKIQSKSSFLRSIGAKSSTTSPNGSGSAATMGAIGVDLRQQHQ